MGIDFNGTSVYSKDKILAGESWKCEYKGTNVNTEVYGASHLLDVCDFSKCNTVSLTLTNTTQIRKLKVGDAINPPTSILGTLT
jgi:hypothetical protein